MAPVTVEVIAYAPTEFYHCTHCEVVWREAGVGRKVHQEQREAGIPADLLEEYTRLSHWVGSVLDRYGDQVVVKVIDAASLEGFFKSVRYGARKYPAIVVDGRDKVVGGDYARANVLLASRLGARADVAPEGGELRGPGAD